MTKTLGWILVGGAALWWGVLRGIDAIKIKFEKIRLVGITSTSMTMNLSVLVKNPLFVDVLVNDIVGDVYLMGEKCAVVNYPINQRLRGGKTSRLQVYIEVLGQQVGQALWANIQTGNINTLLMRFDGYVTVRGMRIPIDRQFTLGEILA